LSAGDTDHDGGGSHFVFDFFASDLAGMGILGAAGFGNAIYGNPHGVAFCAGNERLLRDNRLQEVLQAGWLSVYLACALMGWAGKK
jgi:hypothetical protein